MKKISLLLVLILLFQPVSFAEGNESDVIHDLGNYKIIGARYQVTPPHGGPIYLYKNYGVIDRDGNIIVEPVYESISVPVEGRARFSKQFDDGVKYGFFDENWNIAIEPIYTVAHDFSEGLAAVGCKKSSVDTQGYIDRDGNVVISLVYDLAFDFKDGAAEVFIKDVGYYDNSFLRWGMIDRTGKAIAPCMYRWEDTFDVQMSHNRVNINGTTYENDSLEYPFINYLGYTYIPISFYTCDELGFTSIWTPEYGLTLHNVGFSPHKGSGVIFSNLLGENNMEKNKMYKASLYTGTITIAGNTYSASEVYYPILSWNNVVYIPVLWKQGMEGLGLDYSYDLENESLVFKSSGYEYKE